MTDDPWRPPGREGAGGAASPQHHTESEPYPAANPAGPDAATNPYATPTRRGRSPSPYETPGGPNDATSTQPSGPPSWGTSAPGRRPVPPDGQPARGSYAGAFATSDKHRDRVLSGAGYDSPAYTNDNVAATSMVLGIVGIIVPGVCLLAIAFGHLGLRRLRTSYEGGRGLAIAGLCLGYAMTAIWLAILLLVLVGRSVA